MKNDNDINLIDVIKKSAHIYFKNIFAWLMICFLIYLPMYICEYLIPKQFRVSMDVAGLIYSLNFFKVIVCFLPLVLFNPLAIAAITSVIEQNLYNKAVNASQVMDNSLMKWKELIWAAAIYYSVVLFTSFLVIPAIYFGVSFYFYASIIALSKHKGNSAMVISRLSLMGRWWKAAWLIVLSSILSFVVNFFVISFVPDSIGNLFIVQLLLGLVCKFIDIFFDVVLIVWFLSISIIKTEGKEVEV